MTLRRRLFGWSLKAAGLVVTIAAVFNALDGNFWSAAGLLPLGLGLVVVGTYVVPSPGTGAFTARYMMEVNNELHMVKPPKANVLDPIDAETTQFDGR